MKTPSFTPDEYGVLLPNGHIRPRKLIIAIDPGTQVLGLAIAATGLKYPNVSLVRSAAIKYQPVTMTHEVPNTPHRSYVPTNGFTDFEEDWLKRSVRIIQQLRAMLKGHFTGATEPQDAQVILEMPKTYYSAKGQAASNSDAIIKLAFMAGELYQYFKHCHIPVMTPYAIQWKGTLPKEVTQKRIHRWWGVQPKDHNEADAIGMIDWYVRKFLPRHGINYGIAINRQSPPGILTDKVKV